MTTKYFTSLLLVIAGLSACKKSSNNNVVHDTVNNTFTVEGYVISSNSGKPVAGHIIALSQNDWCGQDDPMATTDSTGYFKISYQAATSSDWIMIHAWMPSYQCVYSDISLLRNIPNWQNNNMGKIYTPLYQ